MEARTLARVRHETEMARRLVGAGVGAGAGVDAETGRFTEGGEGSGSAAYTDGGDILDWGNTGSGVDVRVMAVFDADPEDGHQASGSNSRLNEGGSRGGVRRAVALIDLTADEEEERAVERVMIDLTGLSDDESVCSQEI